MIIIIIVVIIIIIIIIISLLYASEMESGGISIKCSPVQFHPDAFYYKLY